MSSAEGFDWRRAAGGRNWSGRSWKEISGIFGRIRYEDGDVEEKYVGAHTSYCRACMWREGG